MRMIMHDWLNGRSAGCLNLVWFGLVVQTVAIASVTTATATATTATTAAPAIHMNSGNNGSKTLYIQTTEIHELVDMCSTVIYTQTLTRTSTATHINQNGLATQRLIAADTQYNK